MYWRPRVDETRLRRAGWKWTLTVLAHAVPFTIAAILLGVLVPVTMPVALILLVHAWIIPELYAARGANVVRPKRGADAAPEQRALLLLGDLIDREAHSLHRQTELVLERGRFGIWLIGEAGALLVRPGGKRVNCYCVKVVDSEFPRADRIAHLLLAVRSDEPGFATVANLAFSGAVWRLRRRLRPPARQALQVARALAREGADPHRHVAHVS